MDPSNAIAAHISNLVSSESGPKALLVDEESSRILSLVIGHSNLLRHSVLLVEKLSAEQKNSSLLLALRCIAFLRPTAESVHALRSELRNPRFASYRLYFTNTLRRSLVEEIADADAEERVLEVREVFSDYFALDRSLLTCGVLPSLPLVTGSDSVPRSPMLERTVDSIIAALLAIKRKPLVRYQRSSSLCRALAERVEARIGQEGSLFDFRRREDNLVVLVLDRREDPVTPLLNQWTYEAMVHELIGINCNRVTLQNAHNVPEEFQELVLNAHEDDFFRKHRYSNFGDLGISLQHLVDQFRLQSQNSNKPESITEMMRFVRSFPEMRRTSMNISKHVALAGELSRLVSEMNLLEVSQLEQDLACREAEADHRKHILELLQNPKVNPSDKLRVVMLYALRYEGKNDRGLSVMKEALHNAGIGSDGIHLVTAVKEYAGSSKRTSDVFQNRSFFAVATNTVRRGIGGVDNVYTQHEPLLVCTLDDLLRGKLRADEFPLVRNDGTRSETHSTTRESGAAWPFVPAPRELLVVMAGGVTYEEAKCVSAINGLVNSFEPPEGSITASAAAASKQSKASVILLGTCVLNSTSFAVEITKDSNAQRQERFVRSSS